MKDSKNKTKSSLWERVWAKGDPEKEIGVDYNMINFLPMIRKIKEQKVYAKIYKTGYFSLRFLSKNSFTQFSTFSAK